MPQPLPSDVANRSKARKLEVERVTNWEDLVHESSCWDELAGAAIEPNVFYSSFAVLAAMRHLAPSGQPEFLIVRGIDSSDPKAAAVWCGFSPLMRSERERIYLQPNKSDTFSAFSASRLRCEIGSG
jgi:hypothetical protein